MTRTLLPLLLLTLFALGRARAGQDLYNPLAVGLRWEVDVEMKIPAGAKTQGTAVREILGTQTINNLTYFVVKSSFTNMPRMKDFTVFRRKSARGIFAINALDKEKQEYMETTLPLDVGQTWTTSIGSTVITSTVHSKESITVGDKTYDNCIKVIYKSANGPNGTYYQAPDVGNVLETTNVDGTIYTFTLKSFSGLK